MARTLVISDMHIGGYSGLCVLQHPRALGQLTGVLAGYDRLILLGDALELGDGRPLSEVMGIAAPILRAIGAGVAEIVIVPGNHDRHMLREWLEDIGPALKLEHEVPLDATPLLAQIVDCLAAGGAEVEVRYPGYRYSEGIWMTHGHFLDRMLIPEGPYGVFRRRTGGSTPADYEPHSFQQRRAGAIRATHQHFLNPRHARLTAAGLDLQMRRHTLPSLATVLSNLGVRADYVIFGHVHRLGPLAGDHMANWQFRLAPGALPTLFLNTGSWQRDPLLITRSRPPHPYWPGGSVVIDEHGTPRAVGQLEY